MKTWTEYSLEAVSSLNQAIIVAPTITVDNKLIRGRLVEARYYVEGALQLAAEWEKKRACAVSSVA